MSAGHPRPVVEMTPAPMERRVGRRSTLRAPAALPPALKLAFLRAEVQRDLMRVARGLGLPKGEAPSAPQYHEYGRYGIVRVQKVAGVKERRWRAMMEVYGLRHSRNHRRVAVTALIADVYRVARLMGRPHQMPRRSEYHTHGTYSASLLELRLAKNRRWTGVAEAVRLPQTHANRRDVTDAQVMEDYRRACRAEGIEMGGYGLSQVRFAAHADGYGPHLCRNRWGSWSAFVVACGYRARAAKRSGVEYEAGAQKWPQARAA